MMSFPHLRALCGAALCCAAPCLVRAADTLCIEPWQSSPATLLAAAAEPSNLLQQLKETDPSNSAGDITYSALEADATPDGQLELSGQVDVHLGTRQMQADRATYDRNNKSLNVNGAVRYRDPIVLIQGDTGHYGNDGALFSHAQFEFLQQPGHATAEQIAVSPDNKFVTLHRVVYTSCPPPRADWQIRARDLRLDMDASRGVGTSAIVDFEGVPILYLPWISFPLSNARESGLLFPTFGSSSLSGAFLGVPWYWNIAPNQDATFTPTYYSTRGLNLGAEYRLLTESDRGTIDANIMPHDSQTGSERSYVHLVDRYQLGWNTRIDTNFENVSDDEYFEDFTQGTQSTSTPFLTRSIAVTHRDDVWNLRAEMVGYQTIDDTLPVAERPYIQLPRLTADMLWSPPDWTQLQTGFDSELVNFTRAGCAGAAQCAEAAGVATSAVNVSGWRFDAKPQVGLDISGPGYFFRPNAAWEFTQYALRDADGGSSSPDRSLPIVSVDSGLEFERLSGSNGVRYVTLEPQLMYVYIPYRNQNDLPVFDSSTPDPNLIELFRPNRYLGLDRIGDENGLTMGLTTQIFDSASGTRYLSATIGQALYFRQPRVTLPEQALDSLSTSSLIAEIILSAYKNWSLQLDVASNPAVSGIEQDELTLQYHASNQQVANISYRYRTGELEQIDGSIAWPIAHQWDAYARAVYSLFSNPAAAPTPIGPESIEDFAGFQYRGACWNIRALWQRSLSTRTGEHSSGVSFQLELTGLSSVGSQVSTFLEQSIRGYSSSANRQPLF